MGQDIEASPVGHTEDYFRSTAPGSFFNDEVEHGDQAVVALKAKSFLPQICLVKKLLEALCFANSTEKALPLCCTWLGQVGTSFDLFP